MKLSNLFRTSLVLLCFTLAISETPSTTSSRIIQSGHKDGSIGSQNRFLAEGALATFTCDRYPRVCRATGSPGPDCCQKRCIDVATDRFNCGACRKRCKHGEMCCQGNCVNPFFDEKHCGRYGNKCSDGSSCVYGLCSYA